MKNNIIALFLVFSFVIILANSTQFTSADQPPSYYVPLDFTLITEDFESGLINWTNLYETNQDPSNAILETTDSRTGSYCMNVTGSVWLYNQLDEYIDPAGFFLPFWFNFSIKASDGADFMIIMQDNDTTPHRAIGFDASGDSAYGDSQDVIFINNSVGYWDSHTDPFNEGGVYGFFNDHEDNINSLTNDSWHDIAIWLDYMVTVPDGLPRLYINNTFCPLAVGFSCNNANLISNTTQIGIYIFEGSVKIDDIRIERYNYTYVAPITEEPEDLLPINWINLFIFIVMFLIPATIFYEKIGSFAVIPALILMSFVCWLGGLIPFYAVIFFMIIFIAMIYKGGLSFD